MLTALTWGNRVRARNTIVGHASTGPVAVVDRAKIPINLARRAKRWEVIVNAVPCSRVAVQLGITGRQREHDWAQLSHVIHTRAVPIAFVDSAPVAVNVAQRARRFRIIHTRSTAITVAIVTLRITHGASGARRAQTRIRVVHALPGGRLAILTTFARRSRVLAVDIVVCNALAGPVAVVDRT